LGVEPVFQFDSHEKWFPVGVEESLAAVRAQAVATDGSKGPVDPAKLGDGTTRIDFPGKMRQPDLPPVGYRRVVRGAGLFWHQFWLWYLYNPGPSPASASTRATGSSSSSVAATRRGRCRSS
jgi:hypothetical protein